MPEEESQHRGGDPIQEKYRSDLDQFFCVQDSVKLSEERATNNRGLPQIELGALSEQGNRASPDMNLGSVMVNWTES